MIAHVVLICISLMISDDEHRFHVPVGHLYVSFGKMSIQFLYPFFNQVGFCLFVCLFDVELYEFFVYFGC